MAPERTCVACRTVRPKGELVRVAATPEGPVVDRSGRAPGRGAYLCRDRDCIGHALRRGGLSRGLRIPLGPEVLARLGEALEEAVEERT